MRKHKHIVGTAFVEAGSCRHPANRVVHILSKVYHLPSKHRVHERLLRPPRFGHGGYLRLRLGSVRTGRAHQAGHSGDAASNQSKGVITVIGLLLPFLPYILAGLAALGGLGANAWLDFTDWQTAVTFSVVLIACVYVASTKSPWSRLIIAVIIGVALYLKGGIDKEARLAVQHEADKQTIHQNYAAANEAEQARQRRINEEAERAAAVAKEQQDAELASLQEQTRLSHEAAGKDIQADTPSLSLDAVRRLNALRVRGAAGS